LIVITPDAYLNLGKIINIIEEQGFSITNLKIARLNKQEAEKFYEQHRGKPYFNDVVNLLSSDLVLAL
jgi:nucleoside-diphosphate kinase